MKTNFPPYKHQTKEFREHRRSRARALSWQMRTGKSKAMVDLACYSYFLGEIDAVVVMAPNGVHENWVEREIPIHHWKQAGHRAMAWSATRHRLSREKFRAELSSLLNYRDGLAWFTINEEFRSHKFARAFLQRFLETRRCLLVFDESQAFGTPGSKRTKTMRALSKRGKMVRILSGTLAENSPLRLYSQYELLQKGALGFGTYDDFKRRYAVYKKEKTRGGREYPVLDCYQNLDELKRKMAGWTSVVLREDCDDMPKLVRSRRYYDPSEEQMEVYSRILNQILTERQDGSLSVFEGGVRATKIQQTLSSFYIEEDGLVNRFSTENPRLEALVEEVEASSWRGKFIVWARFRVELAAIAERLRREGYTFVEYHGGVSPNAKRHARVSFLEDLVTQGFVGQVSAGGKGLNLSSARTVIRYSYSHDAEKERQGEERATQIGGVDVDLIDIVANNWTSDIPVLIDTHILDNSLAPKTALAEDLTRAGLQAYIEELLRRAG